MTRAALRLANPILRNPATTWWFLSSGPSNRRADVPPNMNYTVHPLILQNVLENYPQFIILLTLASVNRPAWGAAAGAMRLVGFVLYVKGYQVSTCLLVIAILMTRLLYLLGVGEDCSVRGTTILLSYYYTIDVAVRVFIFILLFHFCMACIVVSEPMPFTLPSHLSCNPLAAFARARCS